MNRTRRSVLQTGLTFLGGLTTAGLCAAADFPIKPVKFILGSAAGSVPDVSTRQIAEGLAALLGQPVVVENRPSAGGIVALEALKISAPDGYTLSFVHIGNMSVAPSLFERLPYDTLQDFTHISIFYRGVQVLVMHPAVGANSLADLIALARQRPGALRYSSLGNGTPTQLFMEQFNLAQGTAIQHIPYQGRGAHLAVLSGEVDMLLEGVEPMLPFIRAGKLRAIAVGGPRRVAVLPEVPTFEELGVKDIRTIWLGVVAPKGVPSAIVARLNRDLTTVMQSPAFSTTFESAGASSHRARRNR